MAEKAKEGYESDVSDLEEDDNIIDDLLQSDDTYSGNRYQLFAVDLLLSLVLFYPVHLDQFSEGEDSLCPREHVHF